MLLNFLSNDNLTLNIKYLITKEEHSQELKKEFEIQNNNELLKK